MLGWRLDADVSGDEYRLVQFTPPGSACSIQFGSNLTPAPPGSAHGLLLSVADVEAARQDLAGRGAEITGAFHCASGPACRPRSANRLCVNFGSVSIGTPTGNTACREGCTREDVP